MTDQNQQSETPGDRGQRPAGGGPASAPPVRGLLAWAVILGIVLLMWQLYQSQQQKHEIIPYSPDFINYVKEGRVKECEIVREASGVQYVKGELNPAPEAEAAIDDATEAAKPLMFKVYITEAGEDLKRFLVDHNVSFSVPPQNPYFWQIVSSVLPVLLIFGLLYFIFMRQIRSAGHGALSFGKSRARLLNRDTNKVTFENVGGHR